MSARRHAPYDADMILKLRPVAMTFRVFTSLKKPLQTPLLVFILLLSACDKPAPAPGGTALRPPFDLTLAQENVERPFTSDFTCPSITEPVRDLFFESMYDKKKARNSSIVSPEAYKAYKEETEGIRALENTLATTANRYLRTDPPRPKIAQCVMDWIVYWADHDGFLGKTNSMGEFVRKWALSSIALAYMQVRNDPAIPQELDDKARQWIYDIANLVIRDFSRGPDKNSRNNNHMYWAAWGVASAAMALDNREMFDWAMRQARLGIDQIQDDGSLPLEMDRGPKAFNYHHYAAIPLFLMAEAGSRNGVDLFAENDQGLRRLARLVLANMENQTYFEKKTGKKQDLHRTITSSNLVWLEIYNKHYHDPDALRWLREYRPMKHSRAGGDVTLLYMGLDVPKRKRETESSSPAQ